MCDSLKISPYREVFPEILKKIEEYDSIIVIRHIIPDGDALGSQFGLKRFIEENYPNKKVYAPGEAASVYRLDFFPLPDEIKDELYNTSLVIIVDVAVSFLISGDWKYIKDHSPDIIRIDHHPFEERLAKIECIDKAAPATTQVIGEFIAFTGKKLEKDAAQYLMAGLVTDTAGLNYGFITGKTFSVLNLFNEAGASYEEATKNYFQYNEQEMDLRAYTIENTKISDSGNLAFSEIPAEVLSKYSDFNLNTGAYYLINSFVNSYKAKVWLLIVSDGKTDYIKCEIRAIESIDVSEVAMKYGGGGHS
nr:probable bifunctional oligoribonuclease and PAP phosphatase NrnA [Lytechinus pictus]